VLRTTLRTLREPRYAALSALMALVALVCVGAGTWQIIRFEGKVHDNDALTGNARAAAVPVGQVLPAVGEKAPSADAVRYRTVTASGRYDAAHQAEVRLRSVDGQDGVFVLTPLTTSDGVLLVVRGFHPDTTGGFTTPPAPPTGLIDIRARVQTSDSNRDSAAQIAKGRLISINAAAQAAHLGTRVYNGYVELLPQQPGTRGLIAPPAPDLSNPAGGAVEPQHFAYIVQWYLFAALALAAPFAMARAERRERAATEPEVGHVQTEEERRAAKLADRYGGISR
jgi:cytochrome oxidase assembly protein ShyY1